jgi:aromatic-amino-acid transaminase
MCAALPDLPARSVVLIHACCHNPTGVDLTRAQWDALIPLLAERELLPYLDLAYQGFGDGLAETRTRCAPWRRHAQGRRPMTFVVANSFSKSMSLYGERCGALSVVCADAAEATNVLGQLKFTVRRNYSSPPIHGGQLVAAVLGEPALRATWEGELGAMRERIQAMRRVLHDTLKKKMPRRDFGYFLSQRGMFSYTGLGPAQVDRLREEFAVYLVRSGRLCVAGLNTGNVEATGAGDGGGARRLTRSALRAGGERERLLAARYRAGRRSGAPRASARPLATLAKRSPRTGRAAGNAAAAARRAGAGRSSRR